MEYRKFDIIELEDDEKLVILETLEYEYVTYLYVDKVNEDETDTLGEYKILRVCEDDYLQKETDQNILMKILPLFSKNINSSK